MPRRVLFIINPWAGTGRDRTRRLRGLRGALLRAGFEFAEYSTTHPGHAIEVVQGLAGESDLVVAAGGDGTVHEVATGILTSKHPDLPLAVAPYGTGNDVAQLLGITGDVALLEALKHGIPQRYDVIEVRCRQDGEEVVRHGLLFAAVGFAGDLLKHTSLRVKRWFGPNHCYSFGFFRALMSYRPPRLRIRTSQGEFEDTMFLACAANAPHAGGGRMKLAPGASLQDGLMNLSLISQTGRWEAAQQFPRLLKGTHITHPSVRYFTDTTMTIDADSPVAVAVDGDLIGTTPATFTIRPAALSMIPYLKEVGSRKSEVRSQKPEARSQYSEL